MPNGPEASIRLLLNVQLLCCVWCYCCGINKRCVKGTMNGEDKERKSRFCKKKTKKLSKTTSFEPNSTTKLNDSNAGLQNSAMSICVVEVDEPKVNSTVGYANPDFHIPYIDDSDQSQAATLEKNRTTKIDKKIVDHSSTQVGISSASYFTVGANSLPRKPKATSSDNTVSDVQDKKEDFDKEIMIKLVSYDSFKKKISSENEPKIGMNFDNNVDTTVVKTVEVNSDNENVVIIDNAMNTSFDSTGSSSFHSSDFLEVLEKTRNNVEEIESVRNSYYEKLADAAISYQKIPISIDDEVVVEKLITVELVAEELRNIGDKCLVQEFLPNLDALYFAYSPVSNDHNSNVNNTQISNINQTSVSNDHQFRPVVHVLQKLNPASDSSNHRLSDDNGVVYRRSIENADKQAAGSNDNSTDKTDKTDVVLTTVVEQTATTKSTQISKRFSGNWKEFELKTRRVSSNSLKSSSSGDTDDLKELNITNRQEETSKDIVDDTSNKISNPRDSRVTAEYLTNLCHMMVDDCSKFHRNGSQTPSLSSETLGASCLSIAPEIIDVDDKLCRINKEILATNNGHSKIDNGSDRISNTSYDNVKNDNDNTSEVFRTSPLTSRNVRFPSVRSVGTLKQNASNLSDSNQLNVDPTSPADKVNNQQSMFTSECAIENALEHELMSVKHIDDDDDDVEEILEDINLRRAREASAFARRFFNNGGNYGVTKN